jgi:hypothetical protein
VNSERRDESRRLPKVIFTVLHSTPRPTIGRSDERRVSYSKFASLDNVTVDGLYNTTNLRGVVP